MTSRAQPTDPSRSASGNRRPTLERPVFIVGTMRSGSTLLANCLGAHPRICYVGFELSDEWSRFGGAPIAGVETADPHCPALGAEHASAAVRDALHRRFTELLAEEGGGRDGLRFLNKNPHLSNKLPYLRALFPDAALIVTGRDLRSTVASSKVLFKLTVTEDTGQHHYLPEDPDVCWSCSPPLPAGGTDPARTFPGGDVRVIAEYWLRTYEAIDAELERFERRVLVRHRDFVAAPREELARVVRELDVPPCDFELPVEIDRRRNRKWRRILTPEERESLERFTDRHRDRILALRSADTTL
jgi:hypothetical protein